MSTITTTAPTFDTTPRPVGRRVVVAGIVAVALLLAGCLTPGQDSVLRELNADRRAYNRSNLPTHAHAQANAQAWAEKLARGGRL